MSANRLLLVLPAIACLVILVPVVFGQVTLEPERQVIWHPRIPQLLPGECPFVADPKLQKGDIPVSFYLVPPGESFEVTVWVVQGNRLVKKILDSSLDGANTPYFCYWNGKDFKDRYVDPGGYEIYVIAESWRRDVVSYPVNIVRLGITEIEAQPGSTTNEWQMVYFKKGTSYTFFATPSIHEYYNVADSGDISDLDLNDGSPRPSVPVHTATDEPAMDGTDYNDTRYNYPLCYLKAAQPKFEVTMGSSCTSQAAATVDPGYPIPGMEIRGLASDSLGPWVSFADNIVPGGKYIFTGPALPDAATRVDRTIKWEWQYCKTGSSDWKDIPGYAETIHRFYTNINEPFWRSGSSGIQYSGPWVEASEYLYTFSMALKIETWDESTVQEAFLKGFFGQDGTLTTAIEGICYDTYTMGGNGGATHYLQGSSQTVRLSRLLDNHSLGVYVNCSDVASSTSTMLGMLGVQNVRMVRLGEMFLRAIWGIGSPDYTLDLWGSSRTHRFNYHHIISRDDGIHVSDACMWLDGDGNPDALPGYPGYNCDRPWDGAEGYNALSASNDVTLTLDYLPRLN